MLPGVCTLQLVRECLNRGTGRRFRYAAIRECKFLEMVVPQADELLEIDIRVGDDAGGHEALLHDYESRKDGAQTQGHRMRNAMTIERNDILAVIPTYNNEKTLARVIGDVRRYCTDVLVVNDGSTDSTAGIIAGAGVGSISYAPNRGKGYALRRALRYAAEHGYRYMLTIDSDGQHYASDIPKFVEEIAKTPDALLVGARNLRSDNMPGKNTFANKFSNFWFRVETGIRLDDTQSGFRLYPVRRMKGMRFATRRYEFEVEVLVRAAWRGIEVRNIPVRVFYPEKAERVSHFRPGKDFTRISILNTLLVLGGAAVLLSLAVPAVAHQKEYPALRGRQHHPVEGLEPAAGRLDRAGRLLRHRPAVGLPDDRGRRYGPFHTAEQRPWRLSARTSASRR